MCCIYKGLNVTDYAHVVFSGYGKDPPAETEKLWKLYGPTAEQCFPT